MALKETNSTLGHVVPKRTITGSYDREYSPPVKTVYCLRDNTFIWGVLDSPGKLELITHNSWSN